jgi:MFS family permease
VRGVVAAYRGVLRNSQLTRLLAGEFVSSIGDWLYLVAILVLIYERTQDPVLLGIVGAARVAPYLFLSIPAGIVADRFDRRRILIVTDLARGVLMVVMAALVMADADVALVIAVAIGATCFSAFFGPAIGAYLPSLVRDESALGPANTAYATLNEVTLIIGPAIGALIVAALDLSVAFLLNAISFAIVAAVLWTLPSTGRPAGAARGNEGDREGRAPESADERPHESAVDHTHADAVDHAYADADESAHDGAEVASRFRWQDARRPLTALAIMDGASSFVFGGISILTVVIAFELLGAGETGTGLLNAAVGIGGLVGSLLTGVLVLRRRLGPPILLGAVVMGVGVVALGLSGSLAISMLAIAAASGGALLTEVIYTTLLQRIAPDEVRGRAFGVMDTIDVLLFAAGSFIIPAAAEVFGLEAVMVASGVGVVIVIAVSTRFLGEWATQAPVVDAARSRLAAVAAFARLSPARLEAAERRAVVEPMAAGQVIIRQGDEADRFYVIVKGDVEVSQVPEDAAAALVLRQMGEGEAFGEIGLLSGVPRTATVTATTEGTLLALDKEAFLDLVAEAADLDFPVYDPYLGLASMRPMEPRFSVA